MDSQLIIAFVGILTALGGIATGIVALRKVSTDNLISLRTMANIESDSTMENMAKFNETLRADNIAVHALLTTERAEHDKTRALLTAARSKHGGSTP